MTVRFACPALASPMLTGDGLLIRVKPPAGVLRAAEARLLADVAARYGNGAVELTPRASLQLRGLTPEAVDVVADIVVAAGLACADPVSERRRNVLATPLAPDWALALERAVIADLALADLPAKFGFAVDASGPFALLDTSADIVLRAGPGGWTVSPAGSSAEAPSVDPISTALVLAHAFLDLAAGERRMGALLRRRGEAAIWSKAGLRPRPARHRAASSPPPVGAVSAANAFVAALPFGAGTAALIAALADLAERHGDGVLHLTPWRSVVLSGVDLSVADRVAALGCIVDPADARLRVSACAGFPGCASATVQTRPLAERLARRAERIGPAETIHVSGCNKGCAHPGSAALTFVGRDGRWDLVRDGRAGDQPAQVSLRTEEVLAL